MGFGGKTITSWENMKHTFLERYRDYYRSTNQGEEIFKMFQKEEEILEEFIEPFQYNLQRSKHKDLDKDVLKMILIQARRDDCLEMLNLMRKRDISKEPFDEII